MFVHREITHVPCTHSRETSFPCQAYLDIGNIDITRVYFTD